MSYAELQDVNGNPVPIDHHNPLYHYAPYTIIGVIQRVYLADDEGNYSRIARSGSDMDTNSNSVAELGSVEQIYHKAVLKMFREPGKHIYCDVLQASQPKNGNMGGSVVFKNCLILPTVSDPLDYGIVIPSAQSNGSPSDMTGDGTWCVLGFINGDPTLGYVQQFFNNPLNNKSPRVSDGKVAWFHKNGCEMNICKNGDLVVDLRNAGQTPVVNSDTGQVTPKRSNSLHGAVTVSTKSNITLVAGAGGEGEGAFKDSEIAEGSFTISGRDEVVITSKTKTVEIFTKRDEATQKVINPVNIQAAHGGSMRAAREGDTVEVFAAASGNDIFTYLSTLKTIFGATASAMSVTDGEAAIRIAASGFEAVSTIPLPTFASGKITSGTDYVRLGGPTTADNVLGTSGTTQGDVFELEALDALPSANAIQECVTTAVTDYSTKLAQEGAKETIAATVMPVLKEAEAFVLANEIPNGFLLFPPGTSKVMAIASNKVITSLLSGAIDTKGADWKAEKMDESIVNVDESTLALDGDLSTEPPTKGLYEQLDDAEKELAADLTNEKLQDAVALLESEVSVEETKRDDAYTALNTGAANLAKGVEDALDDPRIKLIKILNDVSNDDYTTALATLDEETGNYIGQIVRSCLDDKIELAVADALAKLAGGS